MLSLIPRKSLSLFVCNGCLCIGLWPGWGADPKGKLRHRHYVKLSAAKDHATTTDNPTKPRAGPWTAPL